MLRLGGASQDAGIAPVVAYFDAKGESDALLFETFNKCCDEEGRARYATGTWGWTHPAVHPGGAVVKAATPSDGPADWKGVVSAAFTARLQTLRAHRLCCMAPFLCPLQWQRDEARGLGKRW